MLEKEYLGAVAAPGVGTVLSIGVAVADFGAFTTASAWYVVSVLELRGISPDDVRLRQALVLSVMMGNAGVEAFDKIAGRVGAHWGKAAVKNIPAKSLLEINKVLGRNFVTKYGTKQGILVLGKTIPFGIGAGIGASANVGFATLTIRTVHKKLGHSPYPGDPGPGHAYAAAA